MMTIERSLPFTSFSPLSLSSFCGKGRKEMRGFVVLALEDVFNRKDDVFNRRKDVFLFLCGK